MDLVGMQEVNNDKMEQALRFVNQQLAESNSKVKKELYLSEQRFNEVNDLFLCTRQENKALRDMVRKLKDQLSMVTQVIVSVQSQSEQMFELINRPHAMAEETERNRVSRAQQIYESRRTERRDLNSIAILEEDEQDESDPQEESNDTSSDMDVTSPALRNHSSSGCEKLLLNSPMVHRLKRPSKNASFNESFETIERERAFKLSRVSRERRQNYAGLTDEPDTIREVRSSPMDIDRSSTAPPQERSKQLDESYDTELEDTIKATLHNMSPVRIEDHDSSSSVGTQTEQYTLRYDISSNADRFVLKKMASESMLSTIDRATAVSEGCESTSCSFEETEFGPEDTIANASCSTPVTKGNRLAKVSSNRNRPLAAAQKMMKSDTSLNRILQPVVVVRPLTEENVRSLARAEDHASERVRGRGRPRNSSRQEITIMNGNCPGSSVWSGTNMEPSSSTENLSVTSNESSRPRRKAAPKTLRENSLRTKMRRN
uniref:Shugoshin C-terminal domain-containing protein n=1 Tax=Anopheles atroparvus TaxID=41427 RepID=A0AAG5D6G1_ANOAO